MTKKTPQEVATETTAMPGYSAPQIGGKGEPPIFAKDTGLEMSSRNLLR